MKHITFSAHDLTNLRASINYNPETGAVILLPRPLSDFEGDVKAMEFYNKRFARDVTKGKRARCVKIPGFPMLSLHRLLWLYQTGEDPAGRIVRFLDGNELNYKWENLAISDYTELPKNTSKTKSLKEHEQFLRECFDYDPEAGFLIWKKRPREHFKSDRAWNIFNAKFSGKTAGTPQGKDSRMQLHFATRAMHPYVSRVIWLLMTGQDSTDMHIDHINRDEMDNRWCNLRLATPSENAMNRTTAPRSGYRGVYITENGTYRMDFSKNGVKISKTYKTLEEAVMARANLERNLQGEFRPDAVRVPVPFSEIAPVNILWTPRMDTNVAYV